MKVVIESPNIALTNHVRAFAENRLRVALARYDSRITQTHMRLCDLSPRPGVDKYCLVEVALTPRGTLLVDVTDTAIEAAIVRAAERAARRLAALADDRLEPPARHASGVAA